MLRSIGIAIALAAISSDFWLCTSAQDTLEQAETTWEKLERKGGSVSKAQVVTSQNGEVTTPLVVGERDLSVYDAAGYFDCRVHIHWLEKDRDQDKIDQRIQKDLSTARLFIWEHWQGKKRGYIRIGFDSVDALTTSHIIIEPDANGKWQIVWFLVGGSGRLTKLPLIRRVDKKVADKSPTPLVFSDADGDEWETL